MNSDDFTAGQYKPTRAATTFAFLCGAFVVLVESSFLRSWIDSKLMHTCTVLSVLGTFGLMGSMFPFVIRRRQMLAVIASATLVVSVLTFFVETLPVTEGNNDSGGVFWFVAMPMILLFVFSCSSYLQLKKLTIAR